VLPVVGVWHSPAMEVLVAGGHGQVALRLLKLLADRGHRGRGLIRNPAHAADLEAVGADPVLCDLEADDPRPHLGSAQAIVFAAGAGPGSGAERKKTVDLGGAVKLIEAAQELGVARYVMVSSMGTSDPSAGGEAMRPYLQAKRDADDALMASGLDWTIVRPGRLTDAPGTGTVDAARALGRRGEITRDDTALVLAGVLERPGLARVAFDVLEGPTPVGIALDALPSSGI
jgi:nucleoside-diphosphate-sugar epimerase